MTHLCTPIFVTDPAQALRDAIRAAESGADLIEFRIDNLDDATDLQRLINDSPLPCIITQRSIAEGGQSTATPQARATLLASPATARAAYIDIELAEYRRLSPDQRAALTRPLILSNHDLQGRPDRLHNLLIEMSATPAQVNKIVWTARSIRDNIEAFELLARRTRPTIALCMGEAGLISRILAKKFGAFLTFAPLSAQSATAPGQISLDDLKRLYRWDALTPSTKVFGVIGSPIAHSLSPHVHNAAFTALNIDAVYVPLLVEPGYESFKAFMEVAIPFNDLTLSGLSVTIPHKENALRYLQERSGKIDPLALRVGAVNTITIDRTTIPPTLHGTTTDVDAILDTITSALKIDRPALKGKRAAIIGAGGTGRTAAIALADQGCQITIFNRTQERAQQIAAQLQNATAANLSDLASAQADIFIQTTSIGMHPKINESVFDPTPPKLSAQTLVFDTVYNPQETKLLRTARTHGAQTASGLEMFARQAESQFRLWTGKTPPTDLMSQTAHERLTR